MQIGIRQSALYGGEVESAVVPLSIGVALIAGMYFPTNAVNRFTPLLYGAYAFYMVLLSVWVLRSRIRPSPLVSIALLSIVPLLLLFSSTTQLPVLRFGALPSYGLLSLLYLTDIRYISAPRWLDQLWKLVNGINIAMGIAILLGVRSVQDFIIAHYAYAGEGLLAAMMLLRKPVLTFASHSIAGFFFYLFFWINLQAYKSRRQKIFMFFAVSYVVLVLAVFSVTGVVLGCIASLQLLLFAWKSTRHKFVACALLFLIVFSAILFGPRVDWARPARIATDILTTPGSGWLGRYVPGGTMYEDLEYVRAHPLSPAGVGFKEGLMAGDSGPIEYLFRGSFILLFLVYAGFYYFLRRNLVCRMHVYVLFVVVLAFETGISTLLYFRTLYLLPVFVVYLNSLNRGSDIKAPA